MSKKRKRRKKKGTKEPTRSSRRLRGKPATPVGTTPIRTAIRRTTGESNPRLRRQRGTRSRTEPRRRPRRRPPPPPPTPGQTPMPETEELAGIRETLTRIQTSLAAPSEFNDLHALFKSSLASIYGRMSDVVGAKKEDQEKLKRQSLSEALGGALYDRVEREQRREQLVRMGIMQDPDYEMVMRRLTGLMGPLAQRRVANKFYGTETRSHTHGGARRYPVEGRPEYGSKFSLFGSQVVPVDARPMKYLNPRTELKQKMKIIRKYIFIYSFFINMDFFDISERDDHSRNDSDPRRNRKEEKVRVGSSYGGEGTDRDVGETKSISPQALKYFIGENSKKKKAKRKLLKKKYKKWKTKHKKMEKIVKEKDGIISTYHKDINTAIDKWSKWKNKYHRLESASSTVGRVIPISPLFSGREGVKKKVLF